MNTTCELSFTRTLAAPPEEVFRAFTHATALRDWLSRSAHTQPQGGGYLFLQWPDFSIVQGVYQKFEAPHLLEFSWQPLGDAKPDIVEIHIEPAEGGGQLTLVHHLNGDCDSARQVYTAAWASALENLESFLLTGIDLRLARRPRMGIYLDALDAAAAARLGVPVSEGILIQGTAPGSGAERSGLIKNDVLVSMDGQPTPVFASLGPILSAHQAGDQVKIEFYRKAEKIEVALELSKFPIPELPATAAALAEAARQGFAGVLQGIREVTAGLSEAEAGRKPSDKEWSIKELVAHFILCERDYQSWAADMLLDHPVNDDIEMRPNVDERITALVARLGSLEALLIELEAAFAETVDLLAGLPQPFVQRRKHLYRRLADWALNVVPGHFNEEHLRQFQDTIASAKS